MQISSSYYTAAKEIESDLAKFMQDIIRTPSLSSEEGAVIERIRQEMLKLQPAGADRLRATCNSAGWSCGHG